MNTDLLNRWTELVHLYIINYIIHSWIDPLFLGGLGVIFAYLLFRLLKLLTED